jgi:hypothetical protein
MPLSDAGKPPLETLTGQNVLAMDAQDQRVTVSASSEAIQDYGWAAIWDTASRKYDKGEVDRSGSQPLVRVTAADCKE